MSFDIHRACAGRQGDGIRFPASGRCWEGEPENFRVLVVWLGCIVVKVQFVDPVVTLRE